MLALFLQTYVSLPSAIAFVTLYGNLCNKMSSEKVPYMIAFLPVYSHVMLLFSLTSLGLHPSFYFISSHLIPPPPPLPPQVFYLITSLFTTFFGLFATLIYPNRMLLHPNLTADWLATLLPAFFLPLIAIFRNWTYALFYMLANLWGSVVVSVLFWGFANEITSVDEAKKYYSLFGLMANVALIFSGQYVSYVSKLRMGLPAGTDLWGHS